MVCSKLHRLWIDIFFPLLLKIIKKKNTKKFWYSLTTCRRWIRFFFVRIPCLSEQICWDIFEKNCFAKNKVDISKIYVLTWTFPLRISSITKERISKKYSYVVLYPCFYKNTLVFAKMGFINDRKVSQERYFEMENNVWFCSIALTN